MKNSSLGTQKYLLWNLISKNILYIVFGLIIVSMLYSIGFMLLDVNDALADIMDSNLLGDSFIEVKNADKGLLEKDYIANREVPLANINLSFSYDEPFNGNSINVNYKNIISYLKDNTIGEMLITKDDYNTNGVLISDEFYNKHNFSLNESFKVELYTNIGGAKEIEFKVKGIFNKNSESQFEGNNFFKNVDVIYNYTYLSEYIISNYKEFPVFVYFESPADLLKCFFEESFRGDYIFNDYNNFYGEYKTLSYLNFFVLFLSLSLIVCAIFIFFNLNKFMVYRSRKKIGILKTYGASDEQISYSFFFIFQGINLLAIGIYLIFSKMINNYSNQAIGDFYQAIRINLNYFYIFFVLIITVIISSVKTLAFNKKLQKISIVKYLTQEE